MRAKPSVKKQFSISDLVSLNRFEGVRTSSYCEK